MNGRRLARATTAGAALAVLLALGLGAGGTRAAGSGDAGSAAPSGPGFEGRSGASEPKHTPPQALFEELFVRVQESGLFVDGKTFADAVPKQSPAVILREYREVRPDTPAALKTFVGEHFDLPTQVTPETSVPDRVPIARHIDRLWNELTRTSTQVPADSSLLALPKPYVVPGGRFRELYYWDTYFTMLGLAQSGRRDLLEDLVADFAYLIDTYGHVPNGARTYYLGRSQPPFFFEMVKLLSPERPADAYARYLPELRREYSFWMEGEQRLGAGRAHRRVVRMTNGAVLNRYWDDVAQPRDESFGEDVALARQSGRPAPEVYRDLRAAAESGWDFSSRWFADGEKRATIDTTSVLPVDLNSLLFGMESAIEAGCRQTKDTACAAEFDARASRRRAAMDRFLWSRSGAYFDYDWQRRRPITRLSAATLYPLFLGVASRPQGTAVAAVVRRELLRAGGIVTTPVRTGEQWDSPNGWPPLQWIAIAGLRDYAEPALAATIACRWLASVHAVYEEGGKLVEKYDVVTPGRRGGGGEYPLQDGFGWTNGVTRQLLALYPDDENATIESCRGPG